MSLQVQLYVVYSVLTCTSSCLQIDCTEGCHRLTVTAGLICLVKKTERCCNRFHFKAYSVHGRQQQQQQLCCVEAVYEQPQHLPVQTRQHGSRSDASSNSIHNMYQPA